MNKKILIFVGMMILLTAVIVFAVQTKYESETVYDDINGLTNADTYGQLFTVGFNGANETYYISNFSTACYYSGTGNYITQVHLFATNSTGGHTGNPLVSSYAFNNTLCGSDVGGTWQNISFPQTYLLQKGTKYGAYINTTAPGGGQAFHFKVNTSAGYGGGQLYRGLGCSDGIEPGCITDFQAKDMAFIIYGDAFVVSPITVVLNSPTDGNNLTTSSYLFNASYLSGTDLINATYYVWNGTGTLVNNSVVVNITGTSNFTVKTISGLIRGNYSWNVLACNSTLTCNFSVSNYTFNIVNASLNAEFYNANVIEGSSEKIQINITLFEGLSITDFNLTYNSTRYSGTQTVSGQDYSLLRTVTAPSISASTGMEFNWTFLFSDGSTYISPSHNQTVSPIGIDDCSVYSKVILNYTLYDEETRILINVTSPNNASMEVDVNISSITNGLTIMNFSKVYTNKSSASVCLNIDLNNSIYRLDSQVRYEASSKVSEFHHIQNYSLTNTTTSQNISLYDLTSTDSTSFLITFKDTNFLPVKDALIDITRKYIADGVFRSVEIPKTDTSGNAVGHFDRDSVIYTIIISKNGEILATFDNVAVVCQDVLIGECTLNLNAASTTIPFTDWDTLGGINYIMSFNKTSRTITTVFTTTDGTNKLVSINTTKFDRFGNTSICTDSLESSAGTLTCVVPGAYGNVTVVSRLYSDGVLVTTNTFYAGDSPTVNFGRNGYVFLLIMMLSIPLMFITSTIGVVIGVFLGLIMGALLLIYTGGSIIGIGSTLIWVFVAGAIIIWKINHTEEV